MKINKKNSYIITDPAEKWVTGLSKRTLRIDSSYRIVREKEKEKFKILLSDPAFLERVKTIRETFNIPLNGFINDNKCLEWARSLYKNGHKKKSFANSIKNIYPKKIGSRWYPAIEYFILFNNPDVRHLFPNPVDLWIENDGEELSLNLRIYKDTSFKDIENMISEIKKHQEIIGRIKKMKIDNYSKNKDSKNAIYTIYDNQLIKTKKWKPKRFGSYKNFLQYKKAYDLRQRGKTYKEIAVELGWSENDWPKIGTYIKRFKEAVEENTLF